jgi:hypothetical protein
MPRPDKIEDRDQQILSRLAHIQHKVDSIDETNAFALRADATKHMETVKGIFKRGKRRAQVYLAANGTRGVVEKSIDRTLRITKYLCEEYSLQPDGRPDKPTRKQRAKKPR